MDQFKLERNDMNEIDNGGHAFPSMYHGHGMSLRDYFAGQALLSVVNLIGIPETDKPDELWNESISAHSYGIADAMLKERNKQ